MSVHAVSNRSRVRSLLLAIALVVAGLSFLPTPPATAAPCDEPIQNPVACENTKAGNPESEWGISGSGSSTIQGFATDISVDQGGTVGFKVDTAASSYRLDIYRMGYYGGAGARKIATVNPTVLTNQPNCLTQSTTGLVDCGNWTQNASWAVPADAVSGIYFAKLVRTDGPPGSSHVYFIVRDDDGGSDMLFQTSDSTWQAYNAYGGNSLYQGSPAGRAYKVSYNRPFTTRSNAPEDFVFNSEYPMVRFLERNGYDVSYTTGVDTDRRGDELLEHKMFLSVGHDEYWSGRQRANVEAARAGGVHLAFFSGNEVFWKTRWENSISADGKPYRTLVSYKETHANAKIDPSAEWTGTWRDPRFSPPSDGGRPENALTGTIFKVNCCAINMQVGSADGKMRFWRNTRVASLATGTTTTVGSSIIGYEWDEDADNGHRPPGAFRLSQTSGSGEILQDYGSSYGSGSATHAMTLYRHASGALVFGAGTIQWPWALDSNHDRGSAAPDVAAQQATINLFADMGVQPTTLMTGLTPATASADGTAPTSTISAPTNDATVPVGDPATVTGTASDGGAGRVGGIEVSTDDGQTWHRATGRESWTYTFTPSSAGVFKIRSRATDDSANMETPGPGISVTAGDGGGGGSTNNCPCTIWPDTATPDRTDPDRSAVEVGVRFRAAADGMVTGIRFYKPVESTGTHVGSLWTNTGTRLGNVTFTNESARGWQQALFAEPIPIQAGTTYVASYFTPSRYAVSSNYFISPVTSGPLTALQDGTDGGNGVYRYTNTAGAFPNNTFKSENYWVDVVFMDSVTPDTTKPTVTTRTPAPNATDVPVGTTATATFDEPVQQSTISFELRDPSANLVASTTGYDTTSRTATLTPASALAPSTTYTARVSGATDAAGNVMDPVTWTFTTAAADTTKPTVTTRNPAPGATNVATNSTVSATFDEPVQQSTITFRLSNPSGPVAATVNYDAATRTARLTPTAVLQAGTTYTANLSGATDASGNMMDPLTWTFTTVAPSTNNCPCTIWPDTATPAGGADSDTSAVELGVKFRTDQDGYVSGIRYYRPPESTGTHVGSLWTSTGTNLATVTFSGGTASGWQQALFDAPVAVSANTSYVASYHTPSRYVADGGYFANAATTRGPLTALRNGTDGGNGVYRYSNTPGSFPNNTYNSTNYWVDVVFQETAVDTTPPTVAGTVPVADAEGVPVTTRPSATFSEQVVESSISMTLRDAAGQSVAGTVAYDDAARTATFTPGTELQYSSGYTVQVSGAADTSGNTMTSVSWTFQTSAPPPPGPELGPGGPIALVTSDANPSSTYLAEIVRAEGLNEFETVKNTSLSSSTLDRYDVVVLGSVSITDAQVTALTSWVEGGGNLIAMRPDGRLLALAGLTAQTGTVSEGYIAVDAGTEPGAGITTETMQFHGTAARYALDGATSVAALYTSATTATSSPAVAWRNVGSNGGQVAVFAYDLARSVIQIRQGNPLWAGQNRDGMSPNRSNDLFFGGSSTDWVDLDKAHIPQADEQQRLLANLITIMNRDKMPVPRFWYFPADHRAVVVATGDDHGNGGTAGRFNTYNAASPSGCSVDLWECPRFSSYIFPGTPLTNTQAAGYDAQGFEVGLHPQNNCSNYASYANLADTYTGQLGTWRNLYPSLPAPTTSRYHCIVWSDWASQPNAELAHGIRLDTNYYYYPGSWVNDRPGFMNGSGMAMRFTDTDGSLIDVFQANTVMTDESEQSYPYTPNTLLDRALGPEGYYGAFTANLHTDNAATFEDTQVLASAQARNVPVVTGRQLLTWLDGREDSSFGDLAWSSDSLTFTVSVGQGGNGLTGMLPASGPGGSTLAGITRGGSPVGFTTSTIKGQQYAMFPALGGSYRAAYSPAGTLSLTAARTTSVTEEEATLTWTSNEPATSSVSLATAPDELETRATLAGSTEDHRITVDDLEPGETYYFRVSSTGPDGTVRSWPGESAAPASFTTPAADTKEPVLSDVQTLALPDGTAQVTWTTDEPATSEVMFGGSRQEVDDLRLDRSLVTEHAVVLTDLAADSTYWLRVSSSDAAGNDVASTELVRFRTPEAGVAVQTAEAFRTGESTGALRVGTAGFGELSLERPGTGVYTSMVHDTMQMVDWRQLVLQASTPPGTTATVSVRTGFNPRPDASWSEWKTVRPDGADIGTSGRFLQYRVRLTASGNAVPTVSAVGFTHSGQLTPGSEHRERRGDEVG